jgi:hypothetical protein
MGQKEGSGMSFAGFRSSFAESEARFSGLSDFQFSMRFAFENGA